MRLSMPFLQNTGIGNLRVQPKNTGIATAVTHVDRIGDKPLSIYMFADDRGGKTRGGYRSGPKELTLQFIDGYLFVGTCTEGI
jgi:hypothetical protein